MDIIKLILEILKGGKYFMQILIDSYVALIIAKRKTIDMVPSHLKAAVLANLNAIGLDGYGDPLPNPLPNPEP